MSADDRVVAVVLAGGVGVRVGLGIPKQLIKIAGKAIVEHTLEALNASQHVDEVIIMMNAESIHELDHLRASGQFSKLTRILPGGVTRNQTTQLAIDAIDGDRTKVLFHDAVRPFINDRIIHDCVRALDDYDAVDTAIPSADTIIQIDDDQCISGIPPRAQLRRGQTPQAFRLETIRRAYELADQDPNFSATDDCGVVFTYLPETRIYVVEGTAQNMKVTEPIDVHIADKIFQLQSASLSLEGATQALNLNGKRIVVLGGSYGIGESIVTQARGAGAVVREYSRTSTHTDVTSRKAVRRALADAADAMGGIDTVIVTAGVLHIAPFIASPKKDFTSTIRTNLVAPAKVAREAFPHLERSQGHLVFFTSSSYTRGRAGYAAYSATKAGVVNLTQALAEEWAEQGVHVNCINPQRTATPMRTAAFGEEPSGTLLNPDDVAHVTLQVATSDLTGQVVAVQVAAMAAAHRAAKG